MKFLFLKIKVIIIIFFLFPTYVAANDVNGDLKVGVTDAITALQVASGVQSHVYLSTGLQWKGEWCSNHIKYNKNDMVEHEGSIYICLTFHISNENNTPVDDENWQVVAKGNQNSTGTSNTISMIAGEAFSISENPIPVYLSKDGLIIEQIESNSDEIIFGVNKFSQSFTTDLGTNAITNISLQLEKFGNPEGDFIVSLHRIDQNQIPENIALTQAKISANIIQNGWNNFSFQISVIPSSSYAIVVSVPNGDSSNNIRWKKRNSDIYHEGNTFHSTNFGFDWSELEESDFCFKIFSNNRVYACKANDLEKLDFIGFVISNADSGKNVMVQVNGIVQGFYGLQIGKKYYIQDNSGIDVNFGSYKKLVGIALNEKEISIFWADSLEFATREEALTGINDYKIMSPNMVIETLKKEINSNIAVNKVYGEYIEGDIIPTPVYIAYSSDEFLIDSHPYDNLFLNRKESYTTKNPIMFSYLFRAYKTYNRITRIRLWLNRNGQYTEPERKIVLSINSVNENGDPKDVLGSKTIDYNLIKDTSVLTNFIFDYPLVVKYNQQYAIVVSNLDAHDKHYLNIFGSNHNGIVSTDNGTTWRDFNFKFCFEMYGNLSSGKGSLGEVYKCNAQGNDEFLGFAINTKKSGEVGVIQIQGIVHGFNNLKSGFTYYLQNNPGIIDIVPGNYSVRCGIAISQEALLIDH